MNNILITGGTGFVGIWLYRGKPKGWNVYYIGQTKYKQMNWYNEKWDGIIHLAPISPTLVIECAKKNQCRLLYASSGIVYYPNEEKEEYRNNKIKWEQECLDSGVDVVAARLFTFSGEFLDRHKAITAFYLAARAGKPLIITGDGATVRSYMHGSLMAHWMWQIFKKGETRKAYDVGSDTPITLLELAKQIVEETCSKSEIIIQGGVDPMPYYMPMDTAKTKALFEK